MTSSNRRGMASKVKIQEFWADELVRRGKFLSTEEVFEDDYCFACGMTYRGDWQNTERAHIVSLWAGGGNGPSNLHNLCRWCHKASEVLTGDEYWAWFEAREFLDVLMERYLDLPGATHAQWKTRDGAAMKGVIAAYYKTAGLPVPKQLRN